MKKIIISLVLILTGVCLVYGQGFDFGGFGGGLPGGAGNSNLSKGMAKADDAQDAMEGRIPMRFFDAVNREPIPGATVEIPTAGSFVTNNQGKIVFPKIPDGSYTLTFRKSGYITTPIEFRVRLGQVLFNWYNISKEIPIPPRPPVPATVSAPPPDTNYRIILEWGEKPNDLDLHFVKESGSNKYHISYMDMRTADDGNAVLDRDDRTGYGPETITIGKTEQTAAYTCYVHDYTNRSSTESTVMAQNGATVRVYSNNRLINTFRIPENAKGTKWNVFKIERGVVVPVNAVTAK